MGHQFRVRVVRRRRKRFLTLAVTVLAALIGYELLQILIPFRNVNPLYQVATVGEPVIHQWKYGGMDEEGYLRFYNTEDSVLMPPSQHTFDADGTFVVIEGHTAGSITYASPIAAVPFQWILIGIGVLAVFSAVTALRVHAKQPPMSFRRKKKFNFSDAAGSNPPTKSRPRVPKKPARFRPRR